MIVHIALTSLHRKHPEGLSITHNVGLQGCSQGYVVQTRETTPHDDVSGRRILGTGEITAEPGDLLPGFWTVWAEEILG